MNKASGKLPLRMVLIVPFLVQIFAVVGLIGYWSYRNGQQAVEELATQLRKEITHRIQEHLNTYLDTPHLINEINTHDLELGKLDLEDITELEHHFWQQIQLFTEASYIYLGTPSALFSGAEQVVDGIPNVAYSTAENPDRSFETYATNKRGDRTELLSEFPDYDVLTRPWYLAAKKAGKPVWGDIYVWVAPYPNVALPAVRPYYNQDGDLEAVFAVDLSLLAIADFLENLEVGKTGETFIIERNGLLVASSTGDLPFIEENQEQKRIQAEQISDPLIQNTALFLKSNFEDLKDIYESQQLRFKQEGKWQLVQVTPYADEYGLDWLIVVIVPESDFMAKIHENNRTTIFLCLAALGVATVVGIITSRWIVQAIFNLNEAAKKISSGEWQNSVDINRTDELGDLARSFNSMANQLKSSFETLESQKEDLARKNEELKQLDEIKNTFLANTSHELRTPLNGIIGIAESLIDGVTGELQPATRSNLFTIIASARRLSNLVNDILDFSKLQHQTISLQLKAVDLHSIVEIVLTLSKPLVGQKDLQLINSIPENFPPAEADENRLQQILYNLVGNAIKFTPSGTVEVSAELIYSGNHHSHLSISVSDTGIGIPEDKFDQIFASFEQADGSTEREYGGTGLGLAITKQLIELHQGTINVTSQIHQGSRFTFTLLIASGTVEKSSLSLSIQNFDALSAMSDEEGLMVSESMEQVEIEDQLKILIVDDEPVNRQVLVNHLSLKNYGIWQASTGQEALDLISNGLKPDVILLDVMMPKMTGYEVTQRLRKRFNATELPILLLTAKTQIQDIVTGLNMGANDYLSKPIAKDELLARLQTQLNLKRLKAENLYLSAELDIIRRMQEMVLPSADELKAIAALDIAGYMQPAEEVGGDYYDVLVEGDRLKIGIGDVTGHGLESSIIMIMAQTAVRTLQESQQTDPVEFLSILNRTLYRNVERINSDKSMTLALLDYTNGVIQLSGQHEEAIVVRREGTVERIDTIDLGLPLGLEDNISQFISQCQIPLNSGDVVVLYTDGIPEAQSADKSRYGIERLCEVVRANHRRSAEEIRQAIISDVQDHIGEHTVFDDMALVILKQK
ncbi:SpoIIE family protein phosphatase [Roseofilum sp. BLCC_M91]|uniref:histidine kinase n=1 Tax=Roseofilum halophilum BLCC-M91 TaxID=3022259 RepID=A0ABT7BNS2_9CYAN|nr:SpoIIE family protein phosphatase [Roseofilum halophilum]MDJ1180806.1 SpoIIE family protein phosphatase [Roseofilum halophilum BLCC-M91]